MEFSNGAWVLIFVYLMGWVWFLIYFVEFLIIIKYLEIFATYLWLHILEINSQMEWFGVLLLPSFQVIVLDFYNFDYF